MNQEQWEEERRKEIEEILKTSRVEFTDHGVDRDWTNEELATDRLLTLLQSQLEAAEKRGKDKGRREERELIKSILESMITETKKYWNEKAPDNCLLCWGDGYCTHKIEREKLQELFASLTNHN